MNGRHTRWYCCNRLLPSASTDISTSTDHLLAVNKMDWLSHEHLSDRQAATEWRGLTLLSVQSDLICIAHPLKHAMYSEDVSSTLHMTGKWNIWNHDVIHACSLTRKLCVVAECNNSLSVSSNVLWQVWRFKSEEITEKNIVLHYY